METFQDSKGNLWFGTLEKGVAKYDGNKLTCLTTKDGLPSDTAITEDAKGNIWFGRDGYGASKFDGKTFAHLTIKEGLNSNNVQSIAADQEGNIWIGTRVAEKDNSDPDKRVGKGGLNQYDGEKVIHFPKIDGLSESDVFTIYQDSSNHLWISTISNGVYKYENNEFINYEVPNSTMSFLKDRQGRIWLGCAGGLFRINSRDEILNTKTNGRWT